MMMSMMTYFGAVLMILLIETDLKEPTMPVAWEHKMDNQGEVVMIADGALK